MSSPPDTRTPDVSPSADGGTIADWRPLVDEPPLVDPREEPSSAGRLDGHAPLGGAAPPGSPSAEGDAPSLARWLAQRPFTLVLSGGFFGFYAHTGLLSALEQAGLRPARVVGVSAGALAGGLWAAGLPAARLEEALRALRREAFWDPGLPLGGLLKGRRFVALLEELLREVGVHGIEQAPLPFTPVVHDVLRRRPRGLDAGPLALAIRASCTVPFMFRPVRWGRTLLVDGGVSDRAGFSALGAGERALYHHLLPTLPGEAALTGESDPGLSALPEACAALAVPGLPRVTPFTLERGGEALERVRAAAARRLSQPR